jgi:DNA polymerase/3'-5' exonuclease PolX
MLSAKDGVVQEGRVIASETEEDIFKTLRLEYLPPEKREI